MTNPAIASGRHSAVEVHDVNQIRVIRSEWTKLRSLRSTVYTLLAAIVLVIALGILISAGRASHDHDRVNFDPVLTSLGGTYLAALAIGVLGVLIISGEYATGMNRATFAAVPHRLPVLWGKALVYAVVAFVTMLIAEFIAFEAGQAVLSGKHLNASLSSPGATRAIFGAALFLTLVGLMGLGLGTLFRRTAGAIAALVALLLIVPLIFNLLPSNWNDDVGPYLPINAGESLFATVHHNHQLSPGAGAGVLCIYAAVLLAGAAVVLKSRDA